MKINKPCLVAIVEHIIVVIILNVIYYIVTLMFLPSLSKTYLMYAYQTNYQDIICLTEVLPKHCYTLPKAESYQIKDYNMSAYNFNKRGICIYSKPHISVTILDYTYAFQEYIWCSVSPSNGENFLLCCIYRSPSSTDANDLQLCSMLEDITLKLYGYYCDW